jgi:hypothetical protein
MNSRVITEGALGDELICASLTVYTEADVKTEHLLHALSESADDLLEPVLAAVHSTDSQILAQFMS